MKKIPLHTQILIGLILGLFFGLLSIFTGLPNEITILFIKPVGTIFVNLLKMIAVPLIIASLIVGVANLGDISRLSRMGGKTILIYLITTTIATTIGLIVVNTLKPGKVISYETRQEIMEMYSFDATETTGIAKNIQELGPLEPIVRMVPDNIFHSFQDNGNMLQVVFISLIFGIALLKIPRKRGQPVIFFFQGLNDVVLKLIDYIMKIAPIGVFALIATLIVELAGDNPGKAVEILGALAYYSLAVLFGLAIMMTIIYPLILKLFARIKYRFFFKSIRDAQILAFSTSSSSATLPVTMECVEKNLGVSEEVSSFVLPLGATINMDGTSMYQSIAAVFIAHAMGIEISLGGQLMIVLTAVLASIGSAGVPGAGMVMLVIVLEAVGIPAAGLALIVAPDRPLDMCRTAVNITGDATVATVVAVSEGEEINENKAMKQNNQ